MLHTDLIRSRAPGYPKRALPHAVTRVIDAERRQQFMDEGSILRASTSSLTYLPPLENEES
jgi:hypothetical protein